MAAERRAHPREPLQLPLRLADGQRAVTRNVSAQGLYIVAERDARLDPWLLLEYEAPEAGLRFAAAGEVLRQEWVDGGLGVAIRLHSARLFPTR